MTTAAIGPPAALYRDKRRSQMARPQTKMTTIACVRTVMITGFPYVTVR